MRKIGIMGGTFNPVHNGHLLIAENARSQLFLDEVRFIPNGAPPHKTDADIESGEHRLRMVALAIEGNPAFVADDRELREKRVSYSCLTLQELHEEFPGDALIFIMGGDSLRDFKTWYHPEIICKYATLAAAVRDECDRDQLSDYAKELRRLYGADVQLIQTPNLSVSSSSLRKRVRMKETIRYQVPENVRVYISENQLYTENR